MPTTKHLSYANIALLLPSPELEAGWLSRIHPPYDFTDFDACNFNFPFKQGVPTPPDPPPTAFRLNVLTWPTGASRPAWFHFVCETSRLDAIRSAVGPTSELAPLTFYDGRAGKTVTAQMTIVGERPFNVTVGDSDETFWLVTLSDVRYLWYMKRGTVTDPSSSTWTALYGQLAGLLGVVVGVDSVDAGYGSPSEKWATVYSAPGALLDAVAYTVGQRVVILLDGSTFTTNWEDAQSASDSYLSGAPAVLSGGRVSGDSLVGAAPESVDTVFTDSSSPAPHVVNDTLVGLSVPGYGAATGLSGYHDTVFADLVFDGSNGAACGAYGAAAATDTYGWRLSDPDVVWPGIEPWVPTGWEDTIEWEMKVRGDGPFSATRVRRGPWREFRADGLVPIPDTGADLTVKEVDGTPTILHVTTIEFYQNDGFVVSEPVAGTARIGLIPASVTYGCGLEVVAGVVRLNLTDVVFDGLYWDNDNCVLGIDFDPCTLTLVGPRITVDLTKLAGTAADTSLVVLTPPPSPPACPSLAFDKTPVTTTTETLVNDLVVTQSGHTVTLTKTRTTYTNYFNAAGVHVDRTAGSPVTTDTLVNVCDPCACDACPDPGEQLYEAAGDYTFTPTATCLYLVETWGPGGNGVGFSDTDGRAGGGGGAYSAGWLCLTTDTDYAVHVPAGGNEVKTSFALSTTDEVSADYGRNAHSGVPPVPGAGGIAANCVGQTAFNGGDGAGATTLPGGGGGGGGAGGESGDGFAGVPGVVSTGGGGGYGGPPGGGPPTFVGDGGSGGNPGLNGDPGEIYGGGGGGGGSGGATTGGIGRTGKVRITWG